MELPEQSMRQAQLTSTNLRRFVAGNLWLIGIVFLIFSRAVRGQRSFLGSLLTMALVVPLFVLVAGYLLVVIPFAYVAHLIASPITAGILASPDGFATAGSGLDPMVRVKQLIAQHEAVFKSFLVGVPALLFGAVSAGLSVFA
jgi:hypothetical protein